MLYISAFFFLTFLSAIRDIITKKILKHSDPDVMAGITGLLISFCLLPFILYEWIKETIFSWSFLFVLTLWGSLYFAGKFFSFTSYKLGDISYITPLKWLVTVFSIFTAFLLFGEIPTIYWFIGIFFIFIGIYVLGFKKSTGFFWPFIHLFTDRASQIYLIAVLCYGFTVAIDKWGIALSTPLFWVFCMNLILFLWTSKKVFSERSSFLREVSPYMGRFLVGTFLQAIVLLSQAYLIQKIPVSYISAFKWASIIFVVFLGGYIFQEKDLKKRVFASCIVLLGIFIIILSEVQI